MEGEGTGHEGSWRVPARRGRGGRRGGDAGREAAGAHACAGGREALSRANVMNLLFGWTWMDDTYLVAVLLYSGFLVFFCCVVFAGAS